MHFTRASSDATSQEVVFLASREARINRNNEKPGSVEGASVLSFKVQQKKYDLSNSNLKFAVFFKFQNHLSFLRDQVQVRSDFQQDRFYSL